MKRVSLCCAAALFSTSIAVLLAQAPALDVKMGLWEVTNVSTIGGQMPTMDLSKLPPEQRARMEEAMKSVMGTHTNTTKTCMTKEKFEKSNFMTGDERQNCVQKITTNTRTTLEGAVTCTGQQAMAGQMHIDAISPTEIKGTVKATSSDARGGAMSIAMTLAGKWLGADCGNVK